MKDITYEQVITIPNGMSDCEFLQQLKKSSELYCNCLPYSTPDISILPGRKDGTMTQGAYNSNSYVSGIIIHAGGTPPNLNTRGEWQAPGYENPMPIKSHIKPIGSVNIR